MAVRDEVVLGEQEVRLRGARHDREEVGHARHLLALLLQEPVEELGADEVVLLAGEPRRGG